MNPINEIPSQETPSQQDISSIDLTELIDSHCHIQDSYNPEEFKITTTTCKKLAVMGTLTNDWDKVSQLYDLFPKRVIPCFGIHPWFSEKTSNEFKRDKEWIDLLLSNLKKCKGAMVGEIGLDKIAVDPITKQLYPFTLQLHQFKLQFQLSALLNLPCSIHVVQCQGSILDYFTHIKKDLLKPFDDPTKEYLSFPKNLMLHSFSGSDESAKGILKISTQFHFPKIYFSISKLVNGRMNFNKFNKLINTIPRDRILLESDTHNINYIDEVMRDIIVLISQALNITTYELISLCKQNGNEFFGV
ncbi:Metallo-dependent hydrolase [Neoconidiobolus thromboides FSU 785]|nr:Metallo-dependent hydrolase [Neoconidiobolus thromboides FSU 785]